jgi:hypothetical protein
MVERHGESERFFEDVVERETDKVYWRRRNRDEAFV